MHDACKARYFVIANLSVCPVALLFKRTDSVPKYFVTSNIPLNPVSEMTYTVSTVEWDVKLYYTIPTV